MEELMKAYVILLVIVVIAGGAYYTGTKTNPIPINDENKPKPIDESDRAKIDINDGEGF